MAKVGIQHKRSQSFQQDQGFRKDQSIIETAGWSHNISSIFEYGSEMNTRTCSCNLDNLVSTVLATAKVFDEIIEAQFM
jgi:hypothetical protein